MALPASRGVRLAVVAILTAAALYLVHRRSVARAEATIEVRAGDQAADVRSLTLTLRRPDSSEVLGSYQGAEIAPTVDGRIARWPLAVQAERYDLTIELATTAGPRSV